jgi:hypothetical protein
MYRRPELRAPPPLSEKGEPIKPLEEKSFLQKYWIYIAIFLAASCAFVMPVSFYPLLTLLHLYQLFFQAEGRKKGKVVAKAVVVEPIYGVLLVFVGVMRVLWYVDSKHATL